MKKAYLTIDDAPSSDMKQKVDFLNSLQIPAIWYCRGEFIEKRIDAIVYAIERGHWIGNHSYSHPYASKISFDPFKEEVHLTEALIERAYQMAQKPRPVKTFRFPFGDRGDGKTDFYHPSVKEDPSVEKLQQFLKQEGFHPLLWEGVSYPYFIQGHFMQAVDAIWTFDNLDYAFLSKKRKEKYGIETLEDLLHRLDLNAPEKGLGLNATGSNEIILMHDFAELSFTFEPMIQAFLRKGLTFSLPQRAP